MNFFLTILALALTIVTSITYDLRNSERDVAIYKSMSGARISKKGGMVVEHRFRNIPYTAWAGSFALFRTKRKIV